MKLQDVPTVILVASGKGGVGKTTVATDLARAGSEQGLTTGLIDADVSTPNSPEVIGGEDMDISDQRLSTGDALIPPTVGEHDIQVISKGLVVPDDVPVLRDGQWRAEVIMDYIENVDWDDDTDLIVIDSPPGSGEELQVVASESPITHGVIVTTPHPSSVRDALKTHEFFKQAYIDHSLVTNMVYIPHTDVVDHVCKTTDFSDIKGVGDSKAESLKELMNDTVEDYDLFGFDSNGDVDLDVPQLATIPYTERFDLRASHYDGLLTELTEGEEVTA